MIVAEDHERFPAHTSDIDAADNLVQLAEDTHEIDAENHVQLIDALVAMGKQTGEGDSKGEKYLPGHCSSTCNASTVLLLVF